jgi:HEAT repeat protein
MTIYIREKFENELKQLGAPPRILSNLLGMIAVNDRERHLKARKALVKKGEQILPVMYKLLNSDHKIIRKEAIKVVELIAHKSSIPVMITMLEDSESEIRWIAAEALINIGRDSIRPLLEALVTNSKFYYLSQGAHHVISELMTDEDPEELRQLVNVIKSGMEVPESITLFSSKALKQNF